MPGYEDFKPKGPVITFTFENQRAAELFLHWMCDGAGEQMYWEWAKFREEEEEGPITGVDFNYHQPGGGNVQVTCGRWDEDD